MNIRNKNFTTKIHSMINIIEEESILFLQVPLQLLLVSWQFFNGHFPEKHFTYGHFPEGEFPERTIPRTDISPIEIPQSNISPYEHFPELHTRWKVSKYGVFSGPYFPVFGPYITPFWILFTQWHIAVQG